MKPAHLTALLLMNVLWSGSYAAFKALSGHLTAGEVVTWRFGIAAVVLAVLWRWLPGAAPRGRDLWRTVWMGLLVFVLGPRLQVEGVHLGNAGDSAVLISLEPLVTAVAAALFLKEHVPARRWLGFAVGMVGILVLNGGWRVDQYVASLFTASPAALAGAGVAASDAQMAQSAAGLRLLASLIFVSSFICESAFSVVGKPLLARASPSKVIACSLFWGVGCNLLLDGRAALAKIPVLSWNDWACLSFLALVCTVVGYTLWYVVIREADVNLAALTILVQPAFGVFTAALLLGEALHSGQLWGTLVIFGGLALGWERTGQTPPR